MLSSLPSMSYCSVGYYFYCRKGDLVTQCYNEIRDVLGDLAALGYREVVHEPVVCDGNEVSLALIADLGVRRVWIPQAESLE